MRISSPIRLNLNLPTLDQGCYQIAHIGKIFKEGLGGTNFEVEVYFIPWLNGRLSGVVQTPVSVNMHHYPTLEIGSFWSSDGKRLPCPSNASFDTIELVIDSSEYKAEKLKDILPGFKFLPGLVDKSVWDEVSFSYFCKFEYNSKIVLIPCSELLRSFYFIDVRIIDYFFSFKSIDTIIRLDNYADGIDRDIKAIIFDNRFEPHELAILTEIILNERFAFGVGSTLSMLRSFWSNKRDKNQVPKANPILNFSTGHSINVQGVGRAFTYKSREYFFIQSLSYLGKRWSFDKLSCSHEGKTSNIADPESLDEISKKEGAKSKRFRAIHSSAISDSNKLGSSQFLQGVVQFDIANQSELPIIEFNEELQQLKSKESNSTIIDVEVDILSENSGGIDKTVAQQKLVYSKSTRNSNDSKKEKDASGNISEFYNNIYKNFELLQDVERKMLKINNEYEKFGENVSVFPYWQKNPSAFYFEGETQSPRLIGIIELKFNDTFFYYFQVLEFGRACVVWLENGEELNKKEINIILKKIAERYGDWSSLKKELDEKPEESFLESLNTYFKLSPKNHINSTDDINRYFKEMQKISRVIVK